MLRRSSLAVAATSAATAAVLTTGTVAVAAGQQPATGAHQKITGGTSSVALNSKSVNALLAAKFGVSATGKAKFTGATLSFPVVGGTYDKGKGTIDESGGITITKGASHVTMKNVHVNLKARTGTAVVSGHGRMPAVVLGAPSAGGGSGHKVTFSGYSVKMSKRLVKVLDKKFATKLFAHHPTLGIGSTTLKVKS